MKRTISEVSVLPILRPFSFAAPVKSFTPYPSVVGCDMSLLIGYLQKRYNYHGRYIEIGCSTRDYLSLVAIQQQESPSITSTTRKVV